MENSEFESVKPCLIPTLNFHTHRRRPLQSQTYRTFARILSHCNALESFSEPSQDDGGDKLALRREHDALVDKNFMELESSLVQQRSPLDGDKKFDASKDMGSVMVNEVNLLDITGTVKQGNEELTQDINVHHLNSSIVRDQSSDVENGKEFSPRREQREVDETFVNEVYDAVNSSTSMEVIADMPRPIGSGNETSPVSVVDFSEGIEHELQLKQKELEELISTSGNLNFSVHDFANEEIEEGEISGGIGIVDQAIDLLFDDAVSLGEKKLDEVLVSEDGERELLNHDGGDEGQGKYDVKSSLLLEKVDGGNDIMKLERSINKEQGASAKIFGDDVALKYTDEHDTVLDTGWNTEQAGCVKETNPPVISVENLAQRGQITYEDIAENKGSVTAETETRVGKKRKGPLTKERRAKKKRKDRIKRAEKNKKLGVRRLKLQPVLKPKKVVYCRHYLQGRCQEGEKCKFSHETTPLTKSTPCSFFARHSCMKGDNCPFDHQLSKYPCNNIVTKGFCSRGADCLFKHETSSKNDTLLISKVSKPELKSPFPTSDSNSTKQVNKEGISDQDIQTKFSTVENFTGKFSENQMPKIVEKPLSHVPKGTSLISHVRSPAGNTRKHEQAAPCLSMDNSVKISNEIAKGMPLRPPRGINFLSFGKSPLDDSANKEKGASGSLLGQSTKNEIVGLSPKSHGGVKIDCQTRITSSESASVVNIMANEVSSVSTPQGIEFLTVGNVPVDNARTVRQLNIGSNNVNSSPACIQDEKIDGLKFSSGTLHGSASSPRLMLQSLDQSGAGNCGGNPSSSKTSLLLNTPTSVQRALQSTLAFAAKIDSEIKLDRPMGTSSGMSRHNSSTFRG